MSSDLRTEDILLQVRDKLNKSQVKLWLPPYYTEETGSNDEELEKLATSFCSSLNIESSDCLLALKSLQARSLERLREREQYQETGLATLKIRVPSHQTRSNQLTVQIKLTDLATDLQAEVAKQINECPDRVKLISKGRVLNSNTTLAGQGVTHGTQIMAIILTTDTTSLQVAATNQNILESTVAAAKLLARHSEMDDDYYSLQIADQSGKKLNLPKEEKQALVVAMALHEKGRVALKEENYALALLLFLEADKEFSVCNAKILTAVDNYALLNLDIAWCYLCLRSVNHLPDAGERLRICEQSFHRSYGPNLERVLALKGTTGNEAALYLRLHLLQAIVFFHQNQREEAARFFNLVETELGNLKVDDTNICTLLEMGYTPEEARLSLRATRGDINEAAELITRRRKEREDLRKKESAERRLNRERRRLGRCADGKQWVEPQLYQLLLSMGFDTQLSSLALRHTNNNVERSVQIIQETPDILRPKALKKRAIEKVVALGFGRGQAKQALMKHFGNVEKAIEELLHHGPPSTSSENPGNSDSTGTSGEGIAGPFLLLRAEPLLDLLQEEDDSEQENLLDEGLEVMEEAFSQLTEGMATHEEDHLDFTLVHEEAFLKEYKDLLNQ